MLLLERERETNNIEEINVISCPFERSLEMAGRSIKGKSAFLQGYPYPPKVEVRVSGVSRKAESCLQVSRGKHPFPRSSTAASLILGNPHSRR